MDGQTDGQTDRRTDTVITIGLPHLRWRGPNNQNGDKSCQKTTTLVGSQPSLNSSHCLSFSKLCQSSRSTSQSRKLWYYMKDLVTRNTHVKYESFTSCGIKGGLYLWSKMLIFSRKLFLKKYRAHFHEPSDTSFQKMIHNSGLPCHFWS